MKTEEAHLQAAQVLKQDHILRTRLEQVRSRMQTHIADVKREIDSLSEALTVEYTGHVALLKQTPKGWACLACVDSRNLPDDVPEDFDLCLPIPKPETMPEWEGW